MCDIQSLLRGVAYKYIIHNKKWYDECYSSSKLGGNAKVDDIDKAWRVKLSRSG